MSSDLPKLPKYKLKERVESKEAAQTQPTSERPKKKAANPPLELRQTSEFTVDEDPMDSTADMLDDAYGSETRTRRRNNLITQINRISTSVFAIFLFFASTLAYAHAYKGWPRLEPTNWYLPFLLSAALSAWLCLKSISLWKDRDGSLALTGLLIAGSVVYWNTYVLEYATYGERIKPSNGLWAPKNVDDLLITTEFNALRGVSKSKAAYNELPTKAYYKAFNSITLENWRPLFKRFLSPEEIQQVNRINIQDNMYLVVERMREKRVATWDSLEEQLENPEFKFRLRQVLLEPYTWLLSYL